MKNVNHNHTLYKKEVLSVLVIILFLLSIFPTQATSNFFKTTNSPLAIQWDVSVNFNEPGGTTDYLVFGEAPDANDGSPPDAYDEPKAPSPPPPYIRAWFTDNLPVPYGTLFRDYRHYPDIMKTWDLYITWAPADSVTPTNITISWLTTQVNLSEYDTVILYDIDNTTQAADMKNQSSYSYLSPALHTHHFQIIASSNNPPNTPYNPNPNDNATNVDIDQDLSWIGGDPDPGDTVTYDVYFGMSLSPPKVADNISNASYDPGTLNYSTIYHWQIISWDNHNASAEGPIWNFSTEQVPNNPPYVPSDPDPPNHAVNVNLVANLSWTGGDPDPDDIVYYDVYFGTTPTPPLVSQNQLSTTYDPGTMIANKQYYWRIESEDNHGASTNGSLWDFTSENNPPLIPSNPSPANGEINVEIDPILSWSGGDPDPDDTVFYDIYFGSTSPPPKKIANQTTTTYYPGDLDFSTTYYWQIVSWDNHGAHTEGPLWQFITELETEPPSVSINKPREGALYLADVVRSYSFPLTLVIGKITIDVEAIDNESGIDKVEYYIDNVIQFTDYQEPYSWVWDERVRLFPRRRDIKVIALDYAGNDATDTIQVWKWL